MAGWHRRPMLRAEAVMSWCRIVAGLAWGGLVAAACGHDPPVVPDPDAWEAMVATRGRCPTDLNDTQVAMTERSGQLRLIFLTNDPSQNEELYRRVRELGDAMANVHPTVNRQGELVESVALPPTELRESALAGGSPSRRGWELVMYPDDQERRALKASMKDRVRLWRRGECPELRDEPIGPRPEPNVDTDRGGSETPGVDR
jgi:hypothetical protein